MQNKQKPLARNNNLVIQELKDETLVYDLDANKVHCLNQTAAAIWKLCDGNNGCSDIAVLFERAFGQKPGENLIRLALCQLKENGLLASGIEIDMNLSSRREIIKRIALASTVVLPLVASLSAPTSASAQSACLCPGGPGPTGNSQCVAQAAMSCGATCNASRVCV